MFKDTIAIVNIRGMIGSAGHMPGVIDADVLRQQIEDAFSLNRIKGVCLRINCPGGAPAQCELLYRHLKIRSKETRVPIYAFVEDYATSGGYWVACAADKIFSQRTSIIGSIGIVSSSFGFEKLIDQFNVQRRTFATGPKKVRLDPFLPLESADIEWINNMQSAMHLVFLEAVRASRSNLSEDNSVLESGDSWLGDDAVKLGLVDGIESLEEYVGAQFGESTRQKVVSEKENMISAMIQKVMGAHSDRLVGAASLSKQINSQYDFDIFR